MHETTHHPFGGAITWSLWFLARLLADNKPAVKIFEMNPDKVNVILSKTVIDFDNPLMQENAILCIRHLTEQSDIIRRKISELKYIDLSPDKKIALEKFILHPK